MNFVIHRPSRDKLARALRRYVAGLITNDDLDEVEVDWRDRGAVAIKEMAWRLYDDMSMHYAAGRHSISRPTRRAIGRWILFLHSNKEYVWPQLSLAQIVNWPLDLLTFGWWERRKKWRFEEFEVAGDFSVWPFISARDFEESLGRPKFLVGRHQC